VFSFFFSSFLGWSEIWDHLVRRPLFDLLRQPRMVDDKCGEVSGMRIHRGNRSTRRKPTAVCPPQIPHNLTWARTRAAAVESRRLTAWATARPDYCCYKLFRQFVKNPQFLKMYILVYYTLQKLPISPHRGIQLYYGTLQEQHRTHSWEPNQQHTSRSIQNSPRSNYKDHAALQELPKFPQRDFVKPHIMSIIIQDSRTKQYA
jgi:hypothetical protein